MTIRRTNEDIWMAIEKIDDDLLDLQLPIAIVEDVVQQAGGDPGALVREGEAFVAKLKEERRLAWQVTARQRGETFARNLARKPVPATMSRADLIGRLNEARSDSKFGAPVVIAFRKRSPESSSDEELRALLEDIESLRALEDNEDETE